MSDYRRYAPILTAKEGEFRALGDLADESKANMFPVMEVPERPRDFDNGGFKKSLDAHLEKVPRNLAEHWGVEFPVAIDLCRIDHTDPLENGRNHAEWLFEQMRSAGVKAVPVCGPSRAEGRIFEAKSTIEVETGLCVRLSGRDFADSDVVGGLPDFVRSFGLAISEADLLLDLGAVTENELAFIRRVLPSLLDGVPSLDEWRSVTIAGSSFPANFSGYKRGINEIPRLEWTFWEDMQARWAGSRRRPAFGDYAISSPDQVELDPRTIDPAASIRYTTEDTWLIVRGSSVKKNGYEQYREMCRELIGHPKFAGIGHCPGDVIISGCASGMTTTGNLTTWRHVGTVHHLRCVSRQVAIRPSF